MNDPLTYHECAHGLDRERQSIQIGTVVAIVDENLPDCGKLAIVTRMLSSEHDASIPSRIYLRVGLYRTPAIRTAAGTIHQTREYYVSPQDIRKNRIQDHAMVLRQEFDL